VAKENQKMLIPEDMYPEMDLEVGVPYRWETIHNHYHEYGDDVDFDEDEPQDKIANVLDIGDIVLVTTGKDAGKIGEISEVKNDIDKWLECLNNPTILAKDPTYLDGTTYEVVSVPKVMEDLYTKKITMDEALRQPSDPSFVLKTIGIFKLGELTKLDPPKEGGSCKDCPKPPDKDPQVGDFVEMTKGGNKGKYGVIESITIVTDKNGEEKRKYNIKEVSIDVVNAKLGTQATK
jgi:ribosomal protein L24